MNSNKEVPEDIRILIKFIRQVVNTLTWSQRTPNTNGALNLKKGWLTLKGDLSRLFQWEARQVIVIHRRGIHVNLTGTRVALR